MKANRIKNCIGMAIVAFSLLLSPDVRANGMDKPLPNYSHKEIITLQTPVDVVQYEVLSGKLRVSLNGTKGRRVIVRLHELDPGGNVNVSLGRQLAAKEVVLNPYGYPDYKAKNIRFKVPVGTGARYGITVTPKGGQRTEVYVRISCTGQMVCFGYPWQIVGQPASPYYRPYTLPGGLSRKLPLVTVEEE